MYFEKYNSCKFSSGQRIVIDCAEKEIGVNLELNKHSCDNYGILCGRVVNSLGNPVQHAFVKLVTDTYDPVFHTKTDGEGNYFIFDIPAHKCYKLIAIAEQYRLSEEIKVCLTEQEILNINLSLLHSANEAGVIAGTVLNKVSCLPINQARVVLFEESNGEEIVKEITTTNELGQFALTKLAIGNYTVKICISGYIGEQYCVHIANGAQISHHVSSLVPETTISKGIVSGVITDQNQTPIPEADVILYKFEQDGSVTPIAYTSANRDGVYLFIDVEPGAYKVMAK